MILKIYKYHQITLPLPSQIHSHLCIGPIFGELLIRPLLPHLFTYIASKINIPTIGSLFDYYVAVCIFKITHNLESVNHLNGQLILTNHNSYDLRIPRPFTLPNENNHFRLRSPQFPLALSVNHLTYNGLNVNDFPN